VAKLDENGKKALSVRDRVHESDRRKRDYERKLADYRERVLDLQVISVD
jgi:hypothetical protein